MNLRRPVSVLVAIVAIAYAGRTQSKPQQFLYVTNERTNTVSAFTINSSSGALTATRGSPFSTGSAPSEVVVDPSGKFAYVSNSESSDVSAYAIDPGSGALSQVAGSPFKADFRPHGIAVDATGKFLYLANENLKVSAYAIIAANGALKPLAGSPFSTGNDATAFARYPSMTVEPSGKFAYVFDDEGANIYAYAIDATSGALTPVRGSPFAVRSGSQTLAVDPAGKFVYLADANNNRVSAYALDATGGSLSPVAGSSNVWAGSPASIAVDPAGKFAYAAGENKVWVYSIDPNSGALKQIAGSPVAAGYFPARVEVEPSGKFVYVMNYGSRTISAYTVDASSGGLKTVAGSPFQNPAAVKSDPFARWFNVGKCDALEHLYRRKAADGALEDSYSIGSMPDDNKIPAAKHDEYLEVPIPRQRLNGTYDAAWYYFYDPRAGIAYRHTGGDSDVTFTVRFAGKPPAGVPHTDLSATRTTSGLKLGASAASVVAKLGQPYVVRNCGLELYIYLQSREGEPNEIEFTIRKGRVIEIFGTSYG